MKRCYYLVLALLLVAVMVVPGAAESVIYDETFTWSYTDIFQTDSGTDGDGDFYPQSDIYMTNQLIALEPKQLMAQGRESALKPGGTQPSGGWNVTFTSGGVEIGSGEYYYFQYYVGSKLYTQSVVDFIDVNWAGVVSGKISMSAPPTGYGYALYNTRADVMESIPSDLMSVDTPGFEACFWDGKHSIVDWYISFYTAASYDWANRVCITVNEDSFNKITRLDLIRDAVPGYQKSSSLYITDAQNFNYTSVNSDDNVFFTFLPDRYPLKLMLNTGLTHWFYATIPYIPDDPGDPGAHYQFSIPSIQPGSAVPVLWTGDPFTVTFDCSSEAFADVDFISYTFGSPEYYRTNQQSGDGSWSAYKRVGTDWFEYNHDTYEFSIPSSAAQARAHTFPGPRLGPDDDNTYKFLGVARAGLGNEVCDQTTYVRVDGPPVAPDASWTGLRVYLWDASSGDLIGQTAQISILHPSGTEIAAASTSNGWVELKIPRPDPWDPSFRYRVQATVSGYQQTDDVYVLPLAIYPAYEVAEVRLYPDSAGPDDPGAGILQFYISDQATGRPIPGAHLEVRGPTGPAHFKITNNQGTARLELPGNLTYSYRIEADGYAGISGTIYLTAGGTSTVRQGLTSPPTQPTTPTQPTGGIPDEDDDSDGFLMESVRAIANLFGVSFGIGKNILGMLLALGVGTATAKHLRGGAQEFGMGMLGGVVLGVLIGLLPIWVLVLLVLIVGLWIGQRYMGGSDS